MDGTVIALVAVVGGFAYAFYEQHTKTQLKMRNQSGQNTELQKELTELRRRVETLEAIVTDKAYTLKEQINKLG